MLMTGSPPVDAERAFTRMRRSRRRAALLRLVRREPATHGQLPVYDERKLQGRARLRLGLHEIPVAAIRSTLEPNKAPLFDRDFRPAPIARNRWQRLWLAEHRGAVLPPISVVAVGDAYAIRDGHHRVSVARARGAVMIDAVVGSATDPGT
jgi:hypothetical protein